MAKISDQLIVIKISKLVKDSNKDALDVIDDSTKDSLVEVIEQLVNDPSIVVELVKE